MPKPVLKGLHNAYMKRTILGMGIAVTLTGLTYHFAVNAPKFKRYADFYKNYDAEKAAERMRDAGVFQSTPPKSADKNKK